MESIHLEGDALLTRVITIFLRFLLQYTQAIIAHRIFMLNMADMSANAKQSFYAMRHYFYLFAAALDAGDFAAR